VHVNACAKIRVSGSPANLVKDISLQNTFLTGKTLFWNSDNFRRDYMRLQPIYRKRYIYVFMIVKNEIIHFCK